MVNSQQKNVTIADAVETDFPSIQEIYRYYVEETTISLEEVSPTIHEMTARWHHSVSNGFPYLVAKIDGNIAGYAYAFQYRSRAAYRFTVEESIYVSKNCQGLGIGCRLLSELISQCQAKGYRQMLAVIAGSDNVASLKFHENMGFKTAGILKEFGFKFNQWIDTVLMQRKL